MSLQVDRIKQRQVRWGQSYTNPNSEEYRTLEDEASYAVSFCNIFQSKTENAFQYMTAILASKP